MKKIVLSSLALTACVGLLWASSMSLSVKRVATGRSVVSASFSVDGSTACPVTTSDVTWTVVSGPATIQRTVKRSPTLFYAVLKPSADGTAHLAADGSVTTPCWGTQAFHQEIDVPLIAGSATDDSIE